MCAQSSYCMAPRCGRTEPDPCFGLCDADVLRAPQLQHSVQHVGRDGHPNPAYFENRSFSSLWGSVVLSGAACPGRSGTPALTLPRISSMTTARAFRGFRFPAEVILWAVRWYLQFPISYRDLEAMLADRGVAVDHTTMYRWVQRFAPELEKRMRRHLRPCRGPWHVDEMYIRVSGQWRYLYRAVDGERFPGFLPTSGRLPPLHGTENRLAVDFSGNGCGSAPVATASAAVPPGSSA